MSLITIKDLSVGFESTVIADGLNLEINSGDYLCIVGENGSGKTTFMRTLLGLQSPLSGQIIWGEGLCSRMIGYLPQQTAISKDFPASVKEIVLSGCAGRSGLRPFYKKEERALAFANMKKLGIKDLAGRCFRELSGGQQQRVLLARALCAASKILLLDEPVSGLDPNVTSEMYKLIHELNKEGITIIMISHDVETSLKYATSVLHMGQTVFYGSCSEYTERAKGGFIR